MVIDLEECLAMDSTFMGTLAGIAMRLRNFKNGVLELASVSERNEQSLDDLGLSAMMAINPPASKWTGHIAEIRGALSTICDDESSDRAELCYQAHKTLCDVNDDNVPKFKSVLEVLESQLEKRGD